MSPGEVGFLLLTSKLGNPMRKPLTVAQFRNLAKRVRAEKPQRSARELVPDDLIALGYSREESQRIVALLEENDILQWYLAQGRKQDCYPITRVSENYPVLVRSRLGLDAPGSLWAKGDTRLLQGEKIALVGSRILENDNREFAYEAGKQAALQGYTLVSGNAKGADRIAQEACLEYGGCVISVVADRLDRCPLRNRILYLSEEGFDLEFTPARAFSRNRVIHTLGQSVLVAQSALSRGGTWSGTKQNLLHGWSSVMCFADGSEAAAQLIQMGANPIQLGDLKNIQAFTTLNLQTKMEGLL